jgi:hypothetical protein
VEPQPLAALVALVVEVESLGHRQPQAAMEIRLVPRRHRGIMGAMEIQVQGLLVLLVAAGLVKTGKLGETPELAKEAMVQHHPFLVQA